ncbi:MAG: hypothetical protein K2O70_03555, partial [Desulfovibrionaceae bacterium]|nr:hypothetical protein [Desulfovibrionaceae bacterium]
MMLVSMYIGRGDETASKRKSRSESLLTFPGREKDTGQRLTVSLSDGQNEIFNNISPSCPLVNYAVEAADEFSPAPSLIYTSP